MARKKKVEQANPVEQAMVDAINECHKQGITDPDKISAAMKKAREKSRPA